MPEAGASRLPVRSSGCRRLERKQFLAFKEWPPELMTSPEFWEEVLPVFRAIAPLVQYLNTAMKVGSG